MRATDPGFADLLLKSKSLEPCHTANSFHVYEEQYVIDDIKYSFFYGISDTEPYEIEVYQEPITPQMLREMIAKNAPKNSVCMSVSIKGALVNWKKKELSCICDDNGNPMKPREARLWLVEQLEAGRKVLPMNKNCDNFDYILGCQGHPENENSN